MSLTFHERNRRVVEELLGPPETEEAHPGLAGCITAEWGQVNYGGRTQSEELARQGVTFYGQHDAAVDYGPLAFAAHAGRIDEVVRVKVPAPNTRKKILLHYLTEGMEREGGGVPDEEEVLLGLDLTKRAWRDAIDRTQGLTGANLKELAWRFLVHGTKHYKSEINSVREASPGM